MPSTSIYGWPYPSPSAPNDVPFDTQNLAEAIEATVKAHRTENQSDLADLSNTVNARTAPPFITGTPYVGAYSSTKPVRLLVRRSSVATDANGLVTAALTGLGGTIQSVLTATCVRDIAASSGQPGIFYVRTDLTTASLVTWQMFNPSTGAAMVSTAATYTQRVEYQLV